MRGSAPAGVDGDHRLRRGTRDPDNPPRFLPLYDSGDHLHPNDAGYEAMGDAIDLKLFKNGKATER